MELGDEGRGEGKKRSERNGQGHRVENDDAIRIGLGFGQVQAKEFPSADMVHGW